jgi:NADP-dependent 3-hydroxy acid dehydrogenase YdfG
MSGYCGRALMTAGIEGKVVAIAFAISQPADVDVNEIVVRPTAQA